MTTEVPEAPVVDEYTRDTIEIEGRLKSGDGFYATRLRLALRGDDLTNPEFAATLPALLGNLGIEPIVERAPVAVAAAPAAGQPATGGAGCPVHGTQYQKPGFRGQGYECKAHAPTQQPWSNDKAWVSQDGSETRFYCKSKWR